MIAAEKRRSMHVVETSLAEQLRIEEHGGAAGFGAGMDWREKAQRDAEAEARVIAETLQPLLEQEAQLE